MVASGLPYGEKRGTPPLRVRLFGDSKYVNGV